MAIDKAVEKGDLEQLKKLLAQPGPHDLAGLLRLSVASRAARKNNIFFGRFSSPQHLACRQLLVERLHQGSDAQATLLLDDLAQYMKPEVFQQRLEALPPGAMNTAVDKTGRTFAHLCAVQHNSALMETLVRKGCTNLDAPDVDGNRPLFAAGAPINPALIEEEPLNKETQETVELLVRAGADVNAVNAKGNTAMGALVLAMRQAGQALNKVNPDNPNDFETLSRAFDATNAGAFAALSVLAARGGDLGNVKLDPTQELDRQVHQAIKPSPGGTPAPLQTQQLALVLGGSSGKTGPA